MADKLATSANGERVRLVAEIRAGEGRLTLAAAQRVGPTDQLFTTELNDKMLAQLRAARGE